MLNTTFSRFVHRLVPPTPRLVSARRSRGNRRRAIHSDGVPAIVETLDKREMLSALTLAQGALTSVSDFLGKIDGAVTSIKTQMSDVPLLGDKVDSSLHSLDSDIKALKDKIDVVRDNLSIQNLEDDLRDALFSVLGPNTVHNPNGLNLLGDSTFPNSTPGTIDKHDIFVKIVDGANLPTLEVNFNLHRDLIDKTLAEGEFSTGLKSLPFKLDVAGQGGVKINVGFDYKNFHFKFDETNGPVFDDSAKDELTLYANAGLTRDAHLAVTVGFLKANLSDGALIDTDNNPDTPPELQKTGLSVIEPIDIKFDGGVPFHPETPYLSADLKLHLDAGFTDATSGINKDFPGFATDFVLHREIGQAPVQASALMAQAAIAPHWVSPTSSLHVQAPLNGALTSLVNPADVSNIVSAAFDNVQFKMGEFISHMLKPIIEKMQDIDKPIKPLLDALRVDLPVLSQLPIVKDLLNADHKDGVSLIDLATIVAKSHKLPANYDQLLNLILFFDNLRNFVDSIATNADINNLVLNLGNHALSNNNDPTKSLLDLGDALKDAKANITTLVDGNLKFDGNGGYSFAGLIDYASTQLKNLGVPSGIIDQLVTAMDPLTNGIDYEFPLFKDPVNSIMQVLIGRDANLFTLNGKYNIPAGSINVPPVGLPIGFNVGFVGNVGVHTVFHLGYDTFGLREAFAGENIPLALADGFFVSDDTVLKVDANIGLKAGFNYAVFDASVEGGIAANIELSVPTLQEQTKDADGDPHKVRLFSELGDCLMDAKGSLSGYLAAKASVGIGPLKATAEYDLPKATIIDFSACLPNPLHTVIPHLADKDPNTGVLTLDIGPLIVNRNIEPTEFNEIYDISEIHDPQGGAPLTIVTAFGRSQTFKGVTKIVGDGGTGSDHIVIEKSVHVDAELSGGIGDDNLDYRGTGNAVLKGGLGDDILHGGNGSLNVLLGEGGNDTLVGGGTSGSTTNIFGISAADKVTDDPGNDLMQGGLGHNIMHGGTGDDVLTAGPLNDSLFGDAGNDTLQAGVGQSILDGGGGDDTFNIASDSGSTQIIGNEGHDTVAISGTTLVDTFDIAASNSNVVVTQAVEGVFSRKITMTAVEDLLVDGGAAADSINVDYLASTRLEHLGLDLSSLLKQDLAVDKIVINGQVSPDTVTIASEQVDLKKPVGHTRVLGGITTVTGLPNYKIDVANVQDDVHINLLGGNDTINVTGVSGPTIIDAGIGDDTFNVSTKQLGDYLGPLTLDSDTGKNTLNVMTDPVATPQSVTVMDNRIATHWADPNSVQGTDQVVNYLETNGGSFAGGINVTTNGIDDHLFVRSTLAGATTSLFTGAGNDSVVVSSIALNDLGHVNDIHGALKIDGGSGANDLHVSDFLGTTSQNVTITNTSIIGLAGPSNLIPIGFKATGGQLSLDLNGSNTPAAIETFLVQSPAAVLTLKGNNGDENIVVQSLVQAATIVGGHGNEQVNVGSANSLSGIQAPLAVFGGGGHDKLTLNDSALAVPGSYIIDANSVTRAGTGKVSYDHNVERVSLDAGSGADNIQVTSQPTAPTFNLNAGSGNDLLTGPNGLNVWQIGQQNAGSLNNNLHFSNTENLRGGTTNDRFVFGVTGRLTGTIKDLGGTGDTLDFSAWQQAINVDLLFQTATATNGAQGVDNVIGGSGNDFIAGDGNANRLDGGNGDDILLGRGGADVLLGGNGRDLLIGGPGADHLFGGPDNGEDILIGGTTSFDNNLGALNAIRTEWTRTDIGHPARIADLQQGVGSNHSVKLSSATVQDDGISDTLTGQGGLDWFWAVTSGPNADQLTDFTSSERLN